MAQAKRSGRPKKPESEKVSYQRIAVYTSDYEKLSNFLADNHIQLTDAFTEMVEKYTTKNS